MTQEEKLEEAKRLYKTANADQKYVLERLFPELKESENEKTKQRIIKLIKMLNEVGGYALHKWESDEMLAWVEKKGEHATVLSEEQMKVLNEVLNFAANHESPYWNDYIFGTLNNLIRQLNKLREE